jgi:hypothetical protein
MCDIFLEKEYLKQEGELEDHIYAESQRDS